MFKKLKDKLAEEVKSSPQRLHQFAQAAQAAVTSASSSISDITNNDLFSIGGDDTPTQSSPAHPLGARVSSNFHDVSLGHTPSPYASGPDREATPTNDDQFEHDNLRALSGSASQRLRKLSTGSAASDVSFRLPSYDSPNMYHLQSDIEVSEAESVPGSLSLERVTKEQVFAAYRRTQDRYAKYRARYADLARHYKTLERENAKARAVLVETQDKALRRISELREQCTLEQSAKAHLENALRVELDEKSLKIDSLNTKIKLLQSSNGEVVSEDVNNIKSEPLCSKPEIIEDTIPAVQNLIDLTESKKCPEKVLVDSAPAPEIASLNIKVQKMEQLAAKYKESLKSLKEKNSQLITEIQIVSNELDKKGKENEQLQAAVKQLTDARQHIQELKERNNELQSEVDNFDKIKAGEVLSVKTELDQALEDIKKLNQQIDVFNKREEENAISLAENKMSIHKELESKEAEIKLLTTSLKAATNEVKSYELITDELKQTLKKSEEEKVNLNTKLSELQTANKAISEMEQKIEKLQKQLQTHEQQNAKITEQFKCMELQMKTEGDEKLAMIDRNNYLENRNQQLIEDNSKKNKQISDLEKELLQNNSNSGKNDMDCDNLRKEKDEAVEEMKVWQAKYSNLEMEIKEERVELVKLQSEIEKLLHNYEKLQLENIELSSTVSDLQTQIQLKNGSIEEAEKQIFAANEDLAMKLNTMQQELTDTTDKMIHMEKEIQHKVMQEAQDKFKATEATIRESYELRIAELLSNHQKSSEKHHKDEIEELKTHIENLSAENSNLKAKLEKYFQLTEEKENLIKKIEELECDQNEFHNLKERFENILSENIELKAKAQSLEQDNETLKSKADQIIQDITNLQFELTEVKKSHDRIETEKDNLALKISQMEQEDLSKSEKERKLYNETLSKNEEVKKNVDKLKQELELLMAEKHKLHNQLLESQYDSKEKDAEITKFKDNNEVWEQKLASILEENNVIHEKCERLKQDKENFHETVLKLEQKVTEYEKKIKQHEEATVEKEFLDLRSNQLENDLKFANLEKDKLLHENQLMKSEISDLQKSESSKTDDIERRKAEKEQLNQKLQELLKKSEQENSENQRKSEKISELEAKIEDLDLKYTDITKEVNIFYEKERTSANQEEIWKTEKDQLNRKIKDISKLEMELATTQQECEKLKEDKSRLVSDIEGLQVHLTKVSKDNSQLNDRIREMIATDEDVVNDNKDDTSAKWIVEIEKLKDGLRSRQDQLEDLERQNSILVEEKLELEDQLKSQNSKENGNNNVRDETERDLEITRLQEKNNNLLEMKTHLESKLADMELIGRSGDSNIYNLEQKNEKLRLKNEKLERRLDEALVSLRHLRALEENTELEYLRNILYEYLTGTGAHSITLAKVLAAVVKFDDRQTQLVLQREKERQGLLGQLGLL